MSKQEKILLWSSNFWYLGAGLLGPLFAVFTQKIGGDIFSITWVWGAYLISLGFFIIIIGKISDNLHNRQKMTLVGYGLNALFTFGYLLVESPFELFLVQLGLGFATALATPTWVALYDEYSGDGAKDGWVWGLSSGFAQMATGIGVIAGGFIVATFSFKTLFILMGTIQILAFLIQARFTARQQ